MASWKKILVEGDAVANNLATADLTQSGTPRTYDVGSSQVLNFDDGTVNFRNSSGTQRLQISPNGGSVIALLGGASLQFRDTDNTNSCTIDVPSNISADYAITLPSAGPGAANKILESDASGNLSWIDTPSGGSSVVTTYTNGTDNRVLTSSGTDSINGEANMTFDGNLLTVIGKANFGNTVRVSVNGLGFAGTDTSSFARNIGKVNSSDQVEIGSSNNELLLSSSDGPRIAGNSNYLRGQTNGGSYTQILGIDAGDNLRVGGPSVSDVTIQNPLVVAPGIRSEITNNSAAGSFGPGAEITSLGGSSTSVTAGRIYYYTGSTWSLFSSATEAAQKALLGIALGSTMNDGFLLKGFVRPNAVASFTAGTLVYGAQNASATTTAPTSGYQRLMGHSVSTAVMYFNPSVEYIDLT